MRVTLLGVLTLVGIAVLIVYAGYVLQQTSQERNAQPCGRIPISPSSQDSSAQSAI